MGGRDHSILCETCGVYYGGLDDSPCECNSENNERHMAYVVATETLAANLAIGGALCQAHEIGVMNSHDWSCNEPCNVCWWPGCGKAAS